jgi:hypothetical protein
MTEEEKIKFWGKLVDPITQMMGKLAVSGNWEHVELMQSIIARAENAAIEEREACASMEIEVVVPTRDYSSMTPLDCYEAALIDQAIAFRAAIRARGQE